MGSLSNETTVFSRQRGHSLMRPALTTTKNRLRLQSNYRQQLGGIQSSSRTLSSKTKSPRPYLKGWALQYNITPTVQVSSRDTSRRLAGFTSDQQSAGSGLGSPVIANTFHYQIFYFLLRFPKLQTFGLVFFMLCMCLMPHFIIINILYTTSLSCCYQKWHQENNVCPNSSLGNPNLEKISSLCFGAEFLKALYTIKFPSKMYQKLSPRKKKEKNHPILTSLRPFGFVLFISSLKLVYTRLGQRESMSQIHRGVHLQSIEQNIFREPPRESNCPIQMPWNKS